MSAGALRLRVLLIVLAVLLAVASTAVLGLVTEHVATRQLERRIGEHLAQRTAELADKLDRGIFERYRDIQINASAVNALGLLRRLDAVRPRLAQMRGTLPDYAWIGLADVHGKVIIATDGLLEGESVAERPWFQAGLRGPHVGDVHPAKLLAALLPVQDGEPMRFLDIAMPVIGEEGVVQGVLAAHLDWRWMREVRDSLRTDAPGTDLLILNRDGQVLLGPPELQDATLDLESVRLAGAGGPGYRIERWPDGKTYLTGYSRAAGYRAYAGLGWIVIERQELAQAFAPVAELRLQFLAVGGLLALVFALLSAAAALRITRPLADITAAAEQLQQDLPGVEIPLRRDYHEVSVLTAALRRLLAEVRHREAQLEHQATHSALTALPNRALLKALTDQALARARALGHGAALLALDLDRSKAVGDMLGYGAQDAIIRAVGARLSACLGSRGSLAHLEDGNFAVLIEVDDDVGSEATAVASRLRQALTGPLNIGDREVFLTASVGVSLFPRDGDDVAALLDAARLALADAQSRGGDRVHFYDASADAAARERLDLERELQTALEQGQLELHYQPQVDLASGRIVGVEALIRWRHPERGMISPAKFIPVAEESGLILPLGDWVLANALAQAQEWQAAGLPPLRIGINVSARQFIEGDLVQRVGALLAQHRLDPDRVKLEITESLLMQDLGRSIEIMRELTAAGVHLAIDDFGTGYSSLSYLKRFPLSELKIDQAFVRELSPDSEDAAIVRTIIALGRNLRLSVIAEGVEKPEQVVFLREAGCDEIQGYYVSRPLPARELRRLLTERPAPLARASSPVA